MSWNYSNTTVQTTLVGGIGTSDAVITIADTSGLPVTYPFSLILDYSQSNVEVVTVTAPSGGGFAVTRGQDGTAAQAHLNGAVVVHGVVARDVQEPQTHMATSSNVHGVGGGSAVVGTATSQALSNKTIDGNANTLTNVGTSSITSLDAVKVTQPFSSLTVTSTSASTQTAGINATEVGRSAPILNIQATGNAVIVDEDGTLDLDRGDLSVSSARAHGAASLTARIFAKATGKVGAIIQKALVGDAFDLMRWVKEDGTIWTKINSLGELSARRLIARPQAGDTADLLNLQDSTGANLALVTSTGVVTLAGTTTGNLTVSGSETVSGSLGVTGVVTTSTDANVGGNINITGDVIKNAETWHNVSFQNSWVDSGSSDVTCRYRLVPSPANCVQLVGSMKNGTTTNNTTVFTLPSGYRPAHKILTPIACQNQAGGDSPRVEINTSGTVNIVGCSGSGAIFFNIIFPLDA